MREHDRAMGVLLPSFVLVLLAIVGCEHDEAARGSDASVADEDASQRVPASDAGVDAALVRCDALEQDCAPGQKCTSVRFDFDQPWPPAVCGDEHAESTSREGDSCFGLPGDDTCGPGLACFNLGTGEGVCSKLCDPRDAEPSCALDRVCVLLSAEPAFALCMPRCDPEQPCPAPYALECVERGAESYCDLRWRDGL